MCRIILISFLSIPLLNAIIIENKSNLIIYAIEHNNIENNIAESFINALAIKPNEKMSLKNCVSVIVFPQLLHQKTDNEWLFIKIPSNTKKVEIDDTLIFNQHFSNSNWKRSFQ